MVCGAGGDPLYNAEREKAGTGSGGSGLAIRQVEILRMSRPITPHFCETMTDGSGRFEERDGACELERIWFARGIRVTEWPRPFPERGFAVNGEELIYFDNGEMRRMITVAMYTGVSV